jgi:multidrug efflux pump subunit AcrA (membrane-fusion protein)
MKRNFARVVLSVAMLMGAVWFCGCGSRRLDSVEASETVAGPQFSATKGLLLPEQTRRSLRLKLAEVIEGKLPGVIEFEVRVYKEGERAAFASGSVSPEEAKLLKAGQAIEIRLAEGKIRAGKVLMLSPEMGRVTGLGEVLVEIRKEGEELPVGTFTTIRVTLDSGKSVMTVPKSALLRCGEGTFVYTVSGEHFVRTAVKIGASDAERVEITDGLYAGDQVVLEPVMSLWITELAAVKGGQACCVEPPKGK